MISQKDILLQQLRAKPKVPGVTPPPPGDNKKSTGANKKSTGSPVNPNEIIDIIQGTTSATDLLQKKLLEAFVGSAAELERLQQKYKQFKSTLESSFKTIKTLNKEFGSTNFAAGMLYKTILGLNQGLVDISKATNFYEERNVKLSKALGITTTKGTQLGVQLDKVSEHFNLGGEATRKYAENIEMQFSGLGSIISKAAGEGSAYAEQLFLANQILVDQYELSEDAANTLINLGMQQGKTAAQTITELEATALAIEETTGNTGVFKEILQDISAISATNSTIFGKYPSQLGIATFTARRLGASFDDIANAARGALNIEQSIGAELEYQLLTGRKINSGNKNILQEFRKAYLTNDPVKMAQSYEQIFATQGDLIKNDINAANSLAAAMGISTEELLRQNRVYEARGTLIDQFKDDPKINALLGEDGQIEINADTIATLQDKLQQLETAGAPEEQIDALKGFLSASKTQESSTEMLIRSLDSLNATIAQRLTKLSPELGDIASRKTNVGKLTNVASTAETGLIDTLSSRQNKELLSALGTLGFGKSTIDNILGAFNSISSVEDFILRPGQPPISFRKDDILIGGTDPFGQGVNSSRMNNTNNNVSADMLASAVSTALQSSNLHVTVKVDPLALKTQAEFRSTRLNRTV
jgi:hypothetical protein